MELSGILQGQGKVSLRWGDALALWDVARYKVTGLHVLSIFYKQCQDTELKRFIHDGVFKVAAPHIEKITKILKTEGQESPSEVDWKEKFKDDRSIKPNTLINDEEIAKCLQEILRAGLVLEASNSRNATREDVKKLLDTVVNDDGAAFDKLLEFQKSKNWIAMTPYIQ